MITQLLMDCTTSALPNVLSVEDSKFDVHILSEFKQQPLCIVLDFEENIGLPKV